MLPLDIMIATMKTTLLCLMTLTLTLSQAFSYSNCALVDFAVPKCLSCLPNFQLAAGQCSTCIANYTLLNGTCVSASALPAASTTTGGASSMSQSLNQIVSNAALFSALQAYIQQLNSNGGSILQTNPCTQIVNNLCVNCSQNYSLINGACYPATSSSSAPTSSSSAVAPASSSSAPASTTSSSASPSSATASSPSSQQSASATTTLPGLTIGSDTQTSSQSSSLIFFPLPFYSLPSVTLSNPTSDSSSSYSDDNCNITDPTLKLCSECYKGYYYHYLFRKCVQTNPQCDNVTKDNVCLSCYSGYTLVNGNCLKSNFTCRTFDASNTCTACYDGYSLVNGSCVMNNPPPQQVQAFTDQFCNHYINGTCTSCSNRYYLAPSGFCMQVDPFCNNYTSNGSCQLCYKGYAILNGSCIPYNPSDSRINKPNNNRIDCEFRSVAIQGICVRVNDQCNTFDLTTALCLSCYRGYLLVSGVCVKQNLG